MLELDLDRLRAGTHEEQRRRLFEQCDWYRTQAPPPEHPTASITYFGPAAANLALAYRLTEQPGYLDEAWRWISTCIGYPHWGKAKLPDHDLDAGWLLHGLSLAYHWLGNDLPPERAAMLRAKLELQGQRLYDFAVETRGQWWASSYWQNHHWICYTGLATAGWVLRRPEWTELATENLDTALDLLADDGSDAEGVVYWRYGVPWLAIYLDLLADAEKRDRWQESSFLRHTFGWRLHQCAPGFELNVDHGDCHDRRSGHSVALYYKLASAYRDGQAQWLADTVARDFFWREAYASGVKPGVMPEAYLELLWYDPTVRPAPPDGPLVRYFPDLGQLTARTSWTSPDATFVSFKAAPGGGHKAWEASHRLRREKGWETLNAGHHHPDAGTFVIVSHGAFLVVEDGYASRKRAEYHNLVLVDGQGWADEDRYHVYKDLPYERLPQLSDVDVLEARFEATAHTAMMYDPALRVLRCDRTVRFADGRLVVTDVLEAEEARVWSWLLHADWPATALDDRTYLIANGRGQLRVDFPPEVTVSAYDTLVSANPTASTPSLSIERRLRTLRADTPRTRSIRLVTTLTPGPAQL